MTRLRAAARGRALPACVLNTLSDSFSALILHKADQSVVSNSQTWVTPRASYIHHFISSFCICDVLRCVVRRCRRRARRTSGAGEDPVNYQLITLKQTNQLTNGSF